MWTAKLTNVEKGHLTEALVITIEYSNGDKVEQVTDTIYDYDSIKKIAQDGINARIAVDQNKAKMEDLLKNPPLGEIDFSVPVVEKTEEAIFAEKKMVLIQKKEELDLGLITQEDYDTVLADIKE